MIAMLDTSQDLDIASAELGAPTEQLLTPLTRYRRQRPQGFFAIDNGGYSRFDRSSFLSLLQRERGAVELCRWVAVPDVVGSARRTLEVFRRWSPLLASWPLAFVAQDGQEDLEIPWCDIAAIFVGGTTEFKMSRSAEHIIRAAMILDKWVHIGRVNSPGRYEHFEALGAHSIDGTGLSRYTHMRKKIYESAVAPRLPLLGLEES